MSMSRWLVGVLVSVLVVGISSVGFCKFPQLGMARALGMGNAFTAVADDGSAVIWNPAGLAQMKTKEFMGSALLSAEDQTMYFATYLTPGTEVSAGGGLSVLRFEDDATNREDSMFIYTIAQQVDPQTALGINVKYRHAELAGASDTVWSFDAGVLYKMDPQTTIGIMVQDVNEPSPLGAPDVTIVNAGVCYQLDPLTKVAVDYYNLTDRQYAPDRTLYRQLRMGVERQVSEQIFLRAGYRAHSPCIGFGISRGLYRIEYGYLKSEDEEIEDQNFLDIRVRF